MTSLYISLVVCMAIAALSPFIASLVPGRAIPEVVFLVFAGALLGSHGVGLIKPDFAAMELLSNLGMGFLFLKAGYEIDPKDLLGKSGRVAAGAWLISLGLGFVLSSLLFSSQGFSTSLSWAALAITMTTTAFGTLAPILEDRGLMGTRVGHFVIIHGAIGELLPIVAMSFLLSSRSVTATLGSFLFFSLIVLVIAASSWLRKHEGTKLWNFITNNSEASTQPLLRMVSYLLTALLLLALVFDFDIVLGAFAAGFILRILFPEGNDELERKLTIVSQSFFQPLFFIISGAGLNLAAATNNIALLIGFIASLIVVRGVVVALSFSFDAEAKKMSWKERFSVATYCTMALPIVVAVASIASEKGIISESSASVLVVAAALTVLIIPILTSLVRVVDEVAPVSAAKELAQEHLPARAVLARHYYIFREMDKAYHLMKEEEKKRGHFVSSADLFAAPHLIEPKHLHKSHEALHMKNKEK